MKTNTKINRLANKVMAIEDTHVSTDFAIIHLAAQAPTKIPEWFKAKWSAENPRKFWQRQEVYGLPATEASILAFRCDDVPSEILNQYINTRAGFRNYETCEIQQIELTVDLLKEADRIYEKAGDLWVNHNRREEERKQNLYFAWRIYFAEQLIQRFTQTDEE